MRGSGSSDGVLMDEYSDTMTCAATIFDVVAQLIAWEGGKEVFQKKWHEQYPRDHF